MSLRRVNAVSGCVSVFRQHLVVAVGLLVSVVAIAVVVVVDFRCRCCCLARARVVGHKNHAALRKLFVR